MKRPLQGKRDIRRLPACRCLPALWLCCLVWPLPAPSDTVTLRGGRTLDGIVIEESSESVVLDIGMGRMSFPRDQVVEILRSSNNENQHTRQAWELRYISEADLPEDCRPLYRDWERLQAIRKRANEGARTLAATAREQVRLQTMIQSTRRAYAEVSQDLAETSMKRNVDAYNAKVQRNNELVAQLNRQQASLESSADRQVKIREDISRYAGELTRFENRFRPVLATYQDREDDRVARTWIGQTADRLAEIEQDFARYSIPASGATGGTLLDVTLNDHETGRFILDTGASLVTLTETMARKLKVRYDPKQPILLRLADGKTSEGYPVVLDSVEVGDARAEQVGAVVVPGPPAPGVEGLLGMSFLSRFELSFDATGNRLELRKFRAR